jgi:hypothetical protein
MSAFDTVLSTLRKAESELVAQLAGLRAAISSLSGGDNVHNARRRGRPPGSKNKSIIIHGKKRRRRKLSAAARKAISDAQKARWAKQKAGAKRKRPALGE